MEVVIPTKVGMTTARTIVQEQKDNDEELIRHLDWVDEVRGKAAIRMASYYQRAITHYNKKNVTTIFLNMNFSPRKSFREHRRNRSRKAPS